LTCLTRPARLNDVRIVCWGNSVSDSDLKFEGKQLQVLQTSLRREILCGRSPGQSSKKDEVTGPAQVYCS